MFWHIAMSSDPAAGARSMCGNIGSFRFVVSMCLHIAWFNYVDIYVHLWYNIVGGGFIWTIIMISLQKM